MVLIHNPVLQRLQIKYGYAVISGLDMHYSKYSKKGKLRWLGTLPKPLQSYVDYLINTRTRSSVDVHITRISTKLSVPFGMTSLYFQHSLTH